MSKSPGPVRPLRFEHLSDAVTEAVYLDDVGYRQTGNWDLAGILRHCDRWLVATFEELVPTPWYTKPMLAVLRRTVGPKLLQRTIKEGLMPPGQPTVASTVPQASQAHDEQEFSSNRHQTLAREAIESLRGTIERFEAHQGPMNVSPLLGPMTRQQADALHRIHLAHHLGYLVPATST